MKKLKAIKVRLASPERILENSYAEQKGIELKNEKGWGEVTKQDTINYRTHRAEEGGLFCEVIFGPVKDYECRCGKVKKITNDGTTCPDCRVECTSSFVRRERMGYINLISPVIHPWYLDRNKNVIGKLLEISSTDIERIVKFDNTYIVLDTNGSDLVKYKEIFKQDTDPKKSLTRQLRKILKEIQKRGEIPADYTDIFEDYITNTYNSVVNFEAYSELLLEFGIRFGTGAEALHELLGSLDLAAELEKEKAKAEKIREVIKMEVSEREKENDFNTYLYEEKERKNFKEELVRINKRQKLIKEFLNSKNNPQNMILTILPVMPPELRPIIALDGGRFTSSEINDLYRKVLNRNQKVKNALDNNYPSIMVNELKRMLQMAVIELLHAKDSNNKSDTKINSIGFKLSKKKGLFRKNLLGKRVDYSGRSVIVVGPNLRINECGIPRRMALELFKPFIVADLVEKNLAENIRAARKMVQEASVKALDSLENVIQGKCVLLNRAPTLHRLGIQAFYVKLVDGKAIRLHPLVCSAFNADFDGDQMAVHLPIGEEAQREAREVMLASKNILLPKDGTPAITPSQDMVLGNYYITVEKKPEKAIFIANEEEMNYKFDAKRIGLNDLFFIPVKAIEGAIFSDARKDQYLMTTVGKVLLNKTFPENCHYVTDSAKDSIYGKENEMYFFTKGTDFNQALQSHQITSPFKKKALEQILDMIFSKFEPEFTSQVADELKDLGFKYSTKSGISISAYDINVPKEKSAIIVNGDETISKIDSLYKQGLYTQNEEYNATIKVWREKQREITSIISDQEFRNLDNSIIIMSDSGARGNISNFTQLVGMRGLMARSDGTTSKVPIKSSFREGLTGLEYYISTHGARKGTVDSALATGRVGYLTRTLVDSAHAIIVNEEDCGTDKSILVSAFIDKNGQIIESLEERITGRYSAEAISGIVEKNQLITKDIASKIVEADITQIAIRSVVVCSAKKGVCQKCYGTDISNNKIVEMGTAVGVIAGQSIGEPSTQLTMRTFHTGGVATEGGDIVGGFPAVLGLLKNEVSYKKIVREEDKAKIGAILLGDGVPVEGYPIIKDTTYGKEAKIVKIEFQRTSDIFEIGIKQYQITFEFENETYQEVYELSKFHTLIIKEGYTTKIGQPISNGLQVYTDNPYKDKSKDLALERKIRIELDREAIALMYIKQLQEIYRIQGIELNDKHFEIVLRKMLEYVEVVNPGGFDIISGPISEITNIKFEELVKEAEESGIAKPVKKQVIVGLGKQIIQSLFEGVIDAASYERTGDALATATIRGETDHLVGLKENVIVGGLIPAGSGFNRNKE